MRLRIRIGGQKRLSCSRLEAWGGPVVSWEAVAYPKIARCEWFPDGRGKGFGGSLVGDAKPGQLLWYGSQLSRGRFVTFGLAWRHHDGELVAQPLLNGLDTAQPIYSAGGFIEPLEDAQLTQQAMELAKNDKDQLARVLGTYMENHLLTGGPIRSELEPGMSTDLLRRLECQAMHWPSHRDVLSRAVDILGRL